MNKKKVSGIVAAVVTSLMVFSIFMFFMEVLKWVPNDWIPANAATPSFFDLMFGLRGSKTMQWPVVPGAVALFVMQILLIVGALVVLVLVIMKKRKTAYLLLAGLALVAVTCGVLSFFMNSFISKCNVIETEVLPLPIAITFKGLMQLNYGAYVYGITMCVTAVGAFVPFTLKYCLK